MTLYVDSSALVKLYLTEAQSDLARDILASEPQWASGAHTLVEVRRTLHQALEGNELVIAREEFSRDWSTMAVIELDEATCSVGAEIAEMTGLRTLDALHLAAAHRAGARSVAVVTFDVRLARAARSLGWTAAGA